MLCPRCGNEFDGGTRCPFCEVEVTGRDTRPGAGSRYRTVNLEKGKPTVEEARRLLHVEIERARRDGVRVLKVIHGYGSSGVGGTLRVELRKTLSRLARQGNIRSMVEGESFSTASHKTRELLRIVPRARNDVDLGRGNTGVTIVLI